jgi:hypothetical protein
MLKLNLYEDFCQQREIDLIVSELYGLSEEEIEIVENS